MKLGKPLPKLIAISAPWLALLGLQLPALAGPALYWYHLYPDIDRSECLRRARGSMLSEKFPIRNSNASRLFGWNDNGTALIACLDQGSRMQVLIVVTSSERDYARYLSEMFKIGMQSGIFD